MDKIHSFLLDVGVPANVRGFEYLHDAINFVLEGKASKGDMMGLYETVGDFNNEKPTRIERCIRTAIKNCIKNSDNKKLCEIFGERNIRNEKIKNGLFISTAVLHLLD